jgi:murein endopeptidase
LIGAWALGFGLASGCLQPLDDVVARLALSFAVDGDTELETTPDASTPVVTSADAATLFVGHAGFEVLDEPRWVRHRVRPHERITAIAARHGVKVDDLMRWNKIDPNRLTDGLDAGEIRRRHVRVFTPRVVPELRKVSYRVGEAEDWDDIAAALRIPEHDLRVQNYSTRSPSKGDVMTAWIDPLEGPSFTPPPAPIDQPPLELHGTGKSIGLPHRGKLVDAVQLPEHPLWVRGNPDHLWASANAITVTHQAFEILRGELGFDRGVLIGSISRRKGGRMAPHRSHQSGRDIDIRLPLRPGLGKTKAPTADEIDWYATWALIEAYARTEAAEVVFLNEAHHGRLYAAARAMGVARERVHDLLRWPKWRGDADPLVQHAEGHNAHLHVRVRCGSDEPKCESGP